MKKKILALVLVLAIMIGTVGCSSSSSSSAESGKTSESNGTSTSTETSEPEADVEDGETYTVKLIFPTMMTIPSDEAIEDVENGINDYLAQNGHADLKLDIVFESLTNYTSDVNMQLASKAPMDIIYTGDLPTAVSNGYLTDLTPYLHNELSGAYDVIKDWIDCGTINGTVYAIPCYKGQVLSWKYIYNEDYGDAYDMDSIKSLDDLDAAFAAMKAKYPDEYFGAYTNQYNVLKNFETHTSQVGTYFATVGDDPTLVNYFETDAFKEGIKKAYEHRQKGYVDPEGSTNTQSHDALVLSGAVKGVIMGHAYSIDTVEKMFDSNNSYGAKFKAVQIATSDMTTNTLTYGIPYTSKNPAKAAEMMNLIWTDEFIASTLIYGLEGKSWVWNDDHTSIEYPDGLGIDTVPYTALYTCGAFGNQFLLYGFDQNTSEADKTFMKDLLDNAWYPPLFGFIPDANKVSTQVAAISNVYKQYYDTLVYGDVDPDVYLPQFLDALEQAGIDDVMKEYQSQVDAWLAAKNK